MGLTSLTLERNFINFFFFGEEIGNGLRCKSSSDAIGLVPRSNSKYVCKSNFLGYMYDLRVSVSHIKYEFDSYTLPIGIRDTKQRINIICKINDYYKLIKKLI